MATATQNLVTLTPGGAITDDMLAGFYFWYSIPEDMVALSRVRRAFREAGLDETRLPKERRPEHVAQEAIRKVERIEWLSLNGNSHRQRIEWRVEHPMRVDDTFVSQVTRHVYDEKHRVVEHPKALRVTFRFKDSSLKFEPLDGASRGEVQPLIDEIQEHFDKNATRMPGYKLRTILRHYVEAAGAENMRGDSGGIYFLLMENPLRDSSKLLDHHGRSINGKEFIAQVRAALVSIYGHAPLFHAIPCVNDEGQREFIKRRLMENVADDAKAFRDECIGLVRAKQAGERKRSFREDVRTRLIEQREELVARRQKFAHVLGDTLDDLARDMELADKALARFLTEANA